MDVYVNGKQHIKLSDKQHFVASGGEGKIYEKGNVVYKVYFDPKKAIPKGKISELRALNRSNIIGPKLPLYDKNGRLIGFTMDRVPNNEFLCQLFTSSYRKQHKIRNKTIIELTENMQETIVYIHDNKCLMVDGNEMNYLVDGKSYSTAYFIDVNSYQTQSFPATAIMPSIYDYSCKGKFTTLSDWFAFAIVSCQLYIGIHPYKGRHPKFDKRDLKGRMKAGVSIFNPDISLPPVVRDFGCVPSNFCGWLEDILEKGQRKPPPLVGGIIGAIPVKITVIKSTDNFEIRRLFSVKKEGGHITNCFYYGGKRVVVTENKIYIDKVVYDKIGSHVVFIDNMDPVFVEAKDGELDIRYKGKKVEFNLAVQKVMVIENRLFVINEGSMNEIVLYESNKGTGIEIVPLIRSTWDILLPKANKVFTNVIYQDVLGKACFVVPVPEVSESASSSCVVKYISQLDKYRIIDAKYDMGILVVIGYCGGKYDKHIINIKNDEYRVIYDIDYQGINFTVLENGVVVMINEDNKMELFFNIGAQTKVKFIEDPDIDFSMNVVRNGTQTVVFKDYDIYSLTMK